MNEGVMALKDEIDDDYITKLLLEDAKQTSKKYAQQGLSSLLSTGRSATALKPNTRFLSHIVREADQHNTALKRKEEAESELRLRALDQYDRPRKKRRIDEDNHHRRNRLLKDIADAANSTKGSGQYKAASRRDSRDRNTKHSHRKQNRVTSDRDDERSHEIKRRHEDSERSAKGFDRSESVSIHRRGQINVPSKAKYPDQQRKRADRSPTSESSDPLECVTGSLARHVEEPQIRGRGSRKQISNIDGHFSPSYDPAQDVSIGSDEDGGDWDMALEALRDRAKWKSNQSARLRDAGFDEDEISRWSKGALNQDKRLENNGTGSIKWSGKGETREWDAGKTLH